MTKDIPDYRTRQVAEALYSYGFMLGDNNYSLQEYVAAGPDKELYFFNAKASPSEVLVLLTEDYISGLEYVKDCFTKDLDATMINLHKVIKHVGSSQFAERRAVQSATVYKQPDDWDELKTYAVDFPPFFFGFLATIKPHNPERFWPELGNLHDW